MYKDDIAVLYMISNWAPLSGEREMERMVASGCGMEDGKIAGNWTINLLNYPGGVDQSRRVVSKREWLSSSVCWRLLLHLPCSVQEPRWLHVSIPSPPFSHYPHFITVEALVAVPDSYTCAPSEHCPHLIIFDPLAVILDCSTCSPYKLSVLTWAYL